MLKAIYTDIDQFSNDEIKSLLPHISEERRLFALRLKNEKRMRECVVSEALARFGLTLAARELTEAGVLTARELAEAGTLDGFENGIKASCFEFSREKGGKPYQTTVPGLFFNISHSGGLCLLAVSDSEVGADIERTGRIKPKNAKAFLSDAEYLEYAKSTDDEDKALTATKYWCRKEAYVKLLGTGFTKRPKDIDTLGIPLKKGGGEDSPFASGAEWTEGDINGEYCWSICQKKINLGIDKTAQIAQCRLTLNFIKTQDIVVELEKS